VSIVGARPQFVKLAPLCRAIEEHNRECPDHQVEHEIIHTGQHYDRDVADVFFNQMQIPVPNYNLAVGSGPSGTQLARMLARMEPVLTALTPDWVIVYGDTNSTLAGALLAARLKFPLAHVEAGCRSAELSQPEEQNRIVADHLSQLLLPVSEKAQANLYREGIGVPCDPVNRRVVVAGDIQLDALLQSAELAQQDAEERLKDFNVESKGYYLLTVHRAENTDDLGRLSGILEAASALDLPVVFPVHPRTRGILTREGFSLNGNLRTISPQGYLEMLTLESHARKILTDSGGVQKEAFYFGVPCLTLRERTEWVETIEVGANRLVGTTPAAILAGAQEQNESSWNEFHPYGVGKAAQRIVAELVEASPSHHPC
jgi:UDP-GlcNAc3NAcA epimerase